MAEHTCSVNGCASKILARGWCSKHYQRWLKTGDPEYASNRTDTERHAGKVCEVQGCESARRKRLWCDSHYWRWRMHGDPLHGGPVRSLPSGSPEERFWARVDRSGACWFWTGTSHSDGYGTFRVDGKRVYAHRYSYELHGGHIPSGFHIDHLCRNPPCVNPRHLEPVTPQVNIARGISAEVNRMLAKDRAMCGNGHLWIENEYLPPDGSSRQCRGCRREAGQRRRAAGKAS